ncbi:DUF4446 family protein [Candidatus Collierbacteria bacterium]|nr:DUF4446 family protein [Candidatus Collierbacteria bacterium]
MNPNLPFILLGIVALWLLVISFLLIRLMAHYQGLIKDVSKKDLLSALNNLVNKTESNQEEIRAVRDHLLSEVKNNKDHLQRIGFKRFNPFTDTGGNQSFILSLLDENGDGIVISSLHSRENTRVYAKKIENGHCPDQELSKDEAQIVKESLK